MKSATLKLDSSTPTNLLCGDSKIAKIKEIELDEKVRFKTNIEELNRVLGGGFVQGSLSLLAGDPGIGKSTLVLQTTKSICDIKLNGSNLKVLYVTIKHS